MPNGRLAAPQAAAAAAAAAAMAAAARSRRALVLLRACHPQPAAFVTLLTCLLALAAGLGGGTVLLLGAAVGAGQLSVGWSNDYLDRDLDRRAHRADKPLAAASLPARTVAIAAIAAIAASAALSLAVGPGFAAVHFAAIGCALAYNAGLKALPLSVLPYALAFGLLPAGVAMALPHPHWPPAWAVAAGALIGAGGHFTQALPDIPSDRRLGVRGLPQLLGQPASAATASVLLLAANLLVALGAEAGRPSPLQALHLAMAIALAAGIVVAAIRGAPRTAFRLTLAAAVVAVLAFLAAGSRL